MSNNRNTNLNKLWCFVLTALLLVLTACQSTTSNQSSDILTQKSSEAGRTQITVMSKHAFTILNFEKIVEEKFPDIDLVIVGNHSIEMGKHEYEKRLANHDITDIVMTWPLEIGEQYWEENFMDLSGMDFTNRYNLSMLDEISSDGKLYYLPGPSQIRGIVYNKTLFEEKGWKVPNNYEEFIKLCQTIEASGIRALQLGFANAEVLDTAFIGYNYADYFSEPQDMEWIDRYNQGEGSFQDHFDGALDVFQAMIDAGIWKEEDLKINYVNREDMLTNRECAMAEDSVLLAREISKVSPIDDEFGLMPFFNPGDQKGWARLYKVCFIGLNKDLEKPVNKKKHDLIMKLMDYISTPEGQTALASDTGGMYSALIGADLPDVPEIDDLVTTLDQGRYGEFFPLTEAQSALRKGLAGMIKGELTKADVIHLVDEENLEEAAESEEIVLGVAEETFSLMETNNWVADMMRDWGESDISLVIDNGKDGKSNGRGITGKIYQGEITYNDIFYIAPPYTQFRNKGLLWKAEILGSDLIQTLEYSIAIDKGVRGWFYYFSGLKMSFDPQAEMGQRIQSISMADGTPFDENKMYTITLLDEAIPAEYLVNLEKTDQSIIELWVETIRESKIVEPTKDERLTIANKSLN